MDMTDFRANLRERLGGTTDQAAPEAPSLDAAWLVLEAANDLGDEAAIAACRRVIDAGLNGALAAPADLSLVQDYFK